MKKILLFVILLAFVASPVLAQPSHDTTPELTMETAGEPAGPQSSLPVDEPQPPTQAQLQPTVKALGVGPSMTAQAASQASTPAQLSALPPVPTVSAPARPKASLVNIKGSYGVAAGFETDKFIWKNANGNYQEKNFRYIDPYEGINTYDQRIFDRYQLEIQTNTGTPWNAYTEIVIDPWSFVGTASETVFNAWGDSATIKYKYWEATGKTINEAYRTNAANSLATQETKVIGGKIDRQVIAPALWGSPAFTLSPNNETEIQYKMVPIRKLWVDYKTEDLYVKIFPIADQAEALTSDDPMQLSNNHPYWGPSPWLYNYVHGIQFTNGSVFQSRWDNTLAAYAQDSSRNFLTFLRGGTVSYKAGDKADFTYTVASPMSLWDDYDYVDSIPMAARLKVYPNDDVLLGFTATDKMGVFKNAVKANNIVGATDVSYRLFGETFAFGEFAGSYADYAYANDMRQGFYGFAYKAGMRATNDISKGNKLIWDLGFTSMSKQFQPGLSDYRDTRVDRDWGRHVLFDAFSEDDWNDRIGDSVDQNRMVIGGNFRAIIMDSLFDIFVNYRNAHEEHTGKFIENIIRVEPTWNPHKRVQVKGLYLQRNYPKAQGDMDPILRERFTDLPWMNYEVTDGTKTTIYTYSGGAKIEIIKDKLALYGIYEATNDPQEFPRGILNNTAFNTTVPADDTDNWLSNSSLMFDRLITQVYSQDLMGAIPPYRFYSIWKGKIGYSPIKNLKITYTHVSNQNKNYAALLDDNHDHDAIDVSYKPYPRLLLRAGWSVSRIIDIRRALDDYNQLTHSTDFKRAWDAHHNVYAQMEYDVNKKKAQKLIVQFGEYGLLSSDMGLFGGPIERKYSSSKASVYDTRAILRLFYMGKF